MGIDESFNFYDDELYRTDADRDSLILRDWHRKLWSKGLPDGTPVEVVPDPNGYLLFCAGASRVRVSSDTIASSHSTYAGHGMPELWEQVPPAERERYERSFYTIAGFIVFPVRPQSLNQRRGTNHQIADRFDLTLECIRQHFLGRTTNPLADVLTVDADFFRLFGSGQDGFTGFVEHFLLQDLVVDGAVVWLDGSQDASWNFDRRPLPTDLSTYLTYLDNTKFFVAARSRRIRRWCDGSEMPEPLG